MTNGVRYTVTIDSRHDLPALFDMLRYEDARVRDWSQAERPGTFTVTIVSEAYTPDRWKSFGLTPKLVGSYDGWTTCGYCGMVSPFPLDDEA